jgi:hypothetical protein
MRAASFNLNSAAPPSGGVGFPTQRHTADEGTSLLNMLPMHQSLTSIVSLKWLLRVQNKCLAASHDDH